MEAFDIRLAQPMVAQPPPVGWPGWDGSGIFEDGETEDYLLRVDRQFVEKLDFGDAPDPTYPTLSASNGAAHVIVPNIFLGLTIDPEADGQPDATATGDDNDGNDDEDGVVFTSALIPGQWATVDLTAGAAGLLDAWVDFNADGSWAEPNDQIFVLQLLLPGLNSLSFWVPATATANINTFARFRFSTVGGLPFTGPASDGEVEDYSVKIEQVYEPQPPSGKYHVKWSQPPVEFDPREPYLYNGWDEPSVYDYPPVVADDWLCEDERPITDLHWWGSFLGWPHSYPPPVVPKAFHIGIWTDVPEGPNEPFSHPGKLIWENYCDNWVWNFAGYDKDPRVPAQHENEACFQFTQLLSQDEWFYQGPNDLWDDDPNSTVYWLSIAAIYDPDQPEPRYPWGWKTRPHLFRDDAVRIWGVEMPSVGLLPVPLPNWPPTIGCKWLQGEPIEFPERVTWDMAFELTTNQPRPGPPKDFARLADMWLEAKL